MAVRSRREFLGRCVTGLGSVGYFAWLADRVQGEPAAAGGSGSAPQRFFEAVRSGNLPAVRDLLEKRADLLSARDRQGRTAFTVAYLSRHEKIGRYLREKGYRPDVHEAALSLDWDRFEELAGGSPETLNQNHAVGGSAMYAAAIGGAGNELWRVYQYGGEPDPRRGPGGGPALMAALEYPDLGTAEVTAATLLGNGASPNLAARGVRSPLHAAAARASVVIVEMLIRKGASVGAKDERGRTALQVAEDRRHEKVTRLLRNHGDIARDHSTSRLAYDVNGEPFNPGKLDAFSVLARNRLVGAAHFRFDEVRKTVDRHPELAKAIATTTEVSVEACAHTGNRPIVEYLLDRGAPYSLPTAVMRKDIKRVTELLAEDAGRIHERGPHDFALLWYPVIGGGSLELAELLIRKGADVERQHHLGTTALHWAVRNGQRDMVNLLIENGADVSRVGRKFDPSGETPLQTAGKRGHDGIAELLKSKGAKS